MTAGPVSVAGHLTIPEHPVGIVVFAHGSGSSRHSPRNRYVAEVLNRAGLATLLFDLLTPDEERNRANVFDIELLARRLVDVTGWLASQPDTASLPVGYFGASTGAGAALAAAADPSVKVAAVVSRGGRPDLAGQALTKVRAPTLLIVGGYDDVVLDLNRRAGSVIPGDVRDRGGSPGHPPLRGAGHARAGRGAGPRLVHRPPEPGGCDREPVMQHEKPWRTTHQGIGVCRTPRICGSKRGRPPATAASARRYSAPSSVSWIPRRLGQTTPSCGG